MKKLDLDQHDPDLRLGRVGHEDIPARALTTLTFLAGFRHDRILVPFVLAGPVNGDGFTA